MRKILKFLFVFIAAGTLLISCEEVQTNHAMLTNPPDINATYYLQFLDAAQTAETGVSVDGELIEIETTVAVALMGMPQDADINVDIAIDGSSTIESDMYTVSANSITIPAGKTSGSVTFTTIAENMPIGETVNFIANMDAGEHNSPSAAAIQVNYSLKRIEFCALDNGAADLVGTWSGSDAWYGTGCTTVLNGDNLDVTGLGWDFLEQWWGEPVIAGGTCLMNVFANGIVEIPRQAYCTTIYDGAEYDYEIEGTGKWTNCGDKPTLLITYDIYYPGEEVGLAAQYSPAYLPTPYMTADVTLD